MKPGSRVRTGTSRRDRPGATDPRPSSWRSWWPCLVSPAPESLAEEPPKAPTVPKTWHATVFFSSGDSYRIIHYWSSGSMMRAETLIGGHPITTIIRGDRYIAFDRLTGKALDVERSPAAVAQDQGRVRPFAIELDELKRAGGEKIEDTTMSGVPVEVWRLTDDDRAPHGLGLEEASRTSRSGRRPSSADPRRR